MSRLLVTLSSPGLLILPPPAIASARCRMPYVQCPGDTSPTATGTATATDTCGPVAPPTSTDGTPGRSHYVPPASGWGLPHDRRQRRTGRHPNRRVRDGPSTAAAWGSGSAPWPLAPMGMEPRKFAPPPMTACVERATELRYHTSGPWTAAAARLPYIVLNLDLDGTAPPTTTSSSNRPTRHPPQVIHPCPIKARPRPASGNLDSAGRRLVGEL